ncbi:hypothetical protein [Achromobacter aegrifaciens]
MMLREPIAGSVHLLSFALVDFGAGTQGARTRAEANELLDKTISLIREAQEHTETILKAEWQRVKNFLPRSVDVDNFQALAIFLWPHIATDRCRPQTAASCRSS